MNETTLFGLVRLLGKPLPHVGSECNVTQVCQEPVCTVERKAVVVLAEIVLLTRNRTIVGLTTAQPTRLPSRKSVVQSVSGTCVWRLDGEHPGTTRVGSHRARPAHLEDKGP